MTKTPSRRGVFYCVTLPRYSAGVIPVISLNISLK